MLEYLRVVVRQGGCKNHRIGLYDGILIKENHIFAAGSIANAVQQAKQLSPNIPIEVEVESIEELSQAIAAGADSALLDNFDLKRLSLAVELNNGKIKLEASGGIDLVSLPKIADTGVDYISIGALTKHLKSIDLSMRFKALK